MNKKTKAQKSTEKSLQNTPVKEIIKQEPVKKKPTWVIKDRVYVIKRRVCLLLVIQ
jgi:histone H3/H4